MQKTIEKVIADPRYLKNIEYGEPRSGHPEGKVKLHIAELEKILEKFTSRISEEHYWKLKFLIHVHDAFKANAIPNSRIENPNSHASLARKFASEFTDDADLLNMLQFHDVNYALWKEYAATGSYDLERFSRLLDTIVDSSVGKDPEKLRWFVREVRKSKATVVDEDWIF